MVNNYKILTVQKDMSKEKNNYWPPFTVMWAIDVSYYFLFWTVRFITPALVNFFFLEQLKKKNLNKQDKNQTIYSDQIQTIGVE